MISFSSLGRWRAGWLGCLLALLPGLRAEEAGTAKIPDRTAVDAAIQRGVEFLLKQQNPAGWWSTADHPGVTGLVLTALNREPSGRFRPHRPSELNRAYDFLLSSARPDGALHRGQLANYNTALSLLALSTADDPNFLPVIRAARAYLAGTQIDFGEPGRLDTPFDGGVGYGSRYQHSDMNNTIMALEAMRWSELALPADERAGRPQHDLNWEAAIHFLQNCQNLPAKNNADWVSDDPQDRGGFVYYPGHTKAQSVTNPVTGRVALRSYGSISYGGLLSYIYARLDQGDPRVTAVLDWLQANYTLDENPGLGPEGYYYYLHLMTKALTAAKVESLRPRDGREIRWRDEVAARLLARQRADGAWVNTGADRWWEGDPVLVTAYSLLALEMLRGHLPPG
ncbi:MAG TPA: terpene cyclase/mutase family protein [Verrucomicrobiota bacterium]|nr:terpene cyclase/mutase family protein [Verrucomicrobiota bacterium]